MSEGALNGASAHLAAARKRLRDRAEARADRDADVQALAIRDAAAIVSMIKDKFRPLRIYQWGSVIREGAFREYSDIDIAVEGVTDAGRFFALLGEAQAMTMFSLDIVQMEKIAREYADDIRRHGRLVYERE